MYCLELPQIFYTSIFYLPFSRKKQKFLKEAFFLKAITLPLLFLKGEIINNNAVLFPPFLDSRCAAKAKNYIGSFLVDIKSAQKTKPEIRPRSRPISP